ncbi:MAG: LysR family transcriptional regulator [Bacteriovoracia bacterium]
METIRFGDINTLLELIRTKSVRESSRNLGVSPGNISKLVKSLELRLGVRLLERTPHGVEATAEAMSVLPRLPFSLPISSRPRSRSTSAFSLARVFV